MSQETIEWLNNNVLVGFIDDRAKWAGQGYAVTGSDGLVKPWFAQDDYTGGYVGPIPIEAIERLMSWEAVERPLYIDMPCELNEADNIDADGNASKRVQVPERKAIVRSDTGLVMYLGSEGYKPHQYREWLVDNIGTILDDEVQVDSAMLLMGGGVAAVSVSLPETVTTAADFAIRPRILAFTSHNGKYATTYQRSVEAPVCDNSLSVEINRGEDATRMRVKHTSQSHLQIAGARDALRILHQQGDDMAAMVDALVKWEVTNKEFAQLLNRLQPVPEEIIEGGKVKNTRAVTMATTRREAIVGLYLNDHRAAPWKGTALGVLQAYNTWDQQVRQVNGERVERKMLATFSGEVDKFDQGVIAHLGEITGVEVRELVGV